MNRLLSVKLIIRNWWRNKLYFFISLFSLTIGLACTNLLVTFFIHEYNIESTNPNRENIYILRQDNPMSEEGKVTYTHIDAGNQIKNNYAEVENMLRMDNIYAFDFLHNGNKIPKATFLQIDSTLTDFFDYKAKEGSLTEVLSTPDKIALNETYARKVFGNKHCIGEIIETSDMKGEKKSYQIAAILEERPQSLLQFDMITAINPTFYGGTTFLRLAEGTNYQTLQQKINDDKVPTLMPGQTQYHLSPTQEIYFSTDAQSAAPTYLHQTHVELLYIALISALLVLVIACFNYSNLNLTRTLQQLKMIHIEKLMGAKLKEIRMQLFLDATIMVLISFLLALLLINDILVLFNGLLDIHLPYQFFFSWQVLPWLLVFALFLAVLPGIYISYRLSRQSLSEYRKQYTGQNRQRLVWALVTIQFILSLGLIYATTISQSQMSLIKNRASRYENVIEIGDMFSGPALQPMYQRLKDSKGIEAMSLSSNGLFGFTMQFSIKQPDGSEILSSKTFAHTDSAFFSLLNIQVKEGMLPSEALKKYDSPFYINENYARLANIKPEDIGVKMKKEIDPIHSPNEGNILAGIFKNIPTSSLTDEVWAQEFTLHNDASIHLAQTGKYLQIRLNPENREETLALIEETWKDMYSGHAFTYNDIHQLFMKNNRETMMLSQVLNTYSLIALILTCFGLFGISWYAVRQRTREIAIRKIHGASTISIVSLLNRPFFIQIAIAYVIAMPIAWWLMQYWLEQFVERAESSFAQFLIPLVIVGIVSCITVSVHTLLAAKTNPMESLKTE